MDLYRWSTLGYSPSMTSTTQTPGSLASVDPRSTTSSGSTDLTDTILLLAPGLIWGASFLFIAEGLRAMGACGVTFARILVGFATLACVPAARAPIARSDRWAVALLGVLWLAFPLSMFPFAEQRVSSPVTRMLNGVKPILTALVASALARRAPSRGVAVGLLVGLAGAVLVAWPSLNEGHSSLVGVMLVLAALVSYGFAIN